jgi:N-formylglutamate deformylase
VSLPVLLSVPHAGTRVPEEVRSYCILTEREVVEDGDEGAAEIYSLSGEVDEFVTTDVARAILDMNRAPEDRSKDGIVKTHTCWDVPVYGEFPPESVIETLLARYYRPYHAELTAAASGVLLGIDCHTMAAKAPPIGPNPGEERPALCLSNADGTCPQEWFESLAVHLERSFGSPVSRNRPFRGGHIIRTHASEVPWVQLEMSRAPFVSNSDKRAGFLAAVDTWVRDQQNT